MTAILIAFIFGIASPIAVQYLWKRYERQQRQAIVRKGFI